MICYPIFGLPGLGSMNECPLQLRAAEPTEGACIYCVNIALCGVIYIHTLVSYSDKVCKGVTESSIFLICANAIFLITG